MASHKEYIEDSVKQPLVPSTLSPSLSEIIQENTEVLCIPFSKSCKFQKYGGHSVYFYFLFYR